MELRSTETEHGSMENAEQLRKRLDDMVRRTKENFHTDTSMEMRRMSKRRAGKQRQVDPESPMLMPTKIVEEEKDFAVDNNVLKSEMSKCDIHCRDVLEGLVSNPTPHHGSLSEFMKTLLLLPLDFYECGHIVTNKWKQQNLLSHN